MTIELTYLVWVSLLTSIIWVPYLVDRVLVWGLVDAVGYPANPKQQSPWATRLKQAHGNAVENLVVFAALVLALNAANISNETTVMTCAVYFWARVVHLAAYTFRVAWIRTLAFVTGFGSQVVLALQYL